MIEFKLTQEQVQALIQLMDAGVRGTGIQAVGSAAELLQIITNAANSEENDG